ncbi:DUF2510 domain-containing protein (plasmid) [Rhodococcus sp. NJ-530]|nr:DUF2510 domain-containing protein [Rhodococcus sp. NJ-530]
MGTIALSSWPDTATGSPLPPPGWYPDDSTQSMRWWDGQAWTDHRAPQSPIIQPVNRNGWLHAFKNLFANLWREQATRWWLIVVAAAIVVGCTALIIANVVNQRDEISYSEGARHGERYAATVMGFSRAGASGGVTKGDIESACTSYGNQVAETYGYDAEDYADGCFDRAYEILSN